jgi:hypothetical protein
LSPSRKSPACITATNVSPPDSHQLPLTNGCSQPVRRRLRFSYRRC